MSGDGGMMVGHAHFHSYSYPADGARVATLERRVRELEDQVQALTKALATERGRRNPMDQEDRAKVRNMRGY